MSTLMINCHWANSLGSFKYGAAVLMSLFLRALHTLGDPIDLLAAAVRLKRWTLGTVRLARFGLRSILQGQRLRLLAVHRA